LGTEDDSPSVLEGGKGSPTGGDATSETGVEKPNPSELLVGIRFFEQCVSWIVDLDLSSFQFEGKKLVETYATPDGNKITHDAKILIQGVLQITDFLALDETHCYEGNESKAYYGCRLYLYNTEADAIQKLYQSGPRKEDMKGFLSLRQNVATLSKAKMGSDWNVEKDGFPFLFDGSTYAGKDADPLKPSDFQTGDVVVAECTVQGYKFGAREGYSLGLCSLYKIESGTGEMPSNTVDGATQESLFAAETPRRMRAPRELH
jgi:hypothetical protein